MAFSFRRGGPQVGAVGALALVAGMTLGKPATAPAAGIAALPDHPRLLWLPETIATGSPRIPNLMTGAGRLAGVTVLGRGQLDRGRYTI